MSTRKVARSATSGHFISLADARRRPATSVVETISYPSRRRLRRRRRAARSGFKAGKDI